MKKNSYIIFTILCSFVCFCKILNSQSVTGYVVDCANQQPIENVNIYYKNSKIGTISNTKGYFEIKNIKEFGNKQLTISHLSYNERIIEINNEKSFDTLIICLNQKSTFLNEVTVNTNYKNILGQRNVSVIDFNFIDQNVLLLVKNHSNNEAELVITSSVFDTINILRSKELRNAISIYKDCLGKCHIVSKDSVYQVDYYDSTLKLTYPFPKQKFYEIADNCLFEIERYLVFSKISNTAFFNEFYAINTLNNKTKIIYSGTQSQKLKHLNFEINYIITHPELFTDINEAILFEKKVMFRPAKIFLNKIGDSIYLFDHSNDCIDIFSLNLDFIRSIKINYHLNRNWKNKIIIDQIENRAYTTIIENNMETVFWIDLINGEIIRKVKIPYIFPYKIMINSGYLYVLFKEFPNSNINKKVYLHKL